MVYIVLELAKGGQVFEYLSIKKSLSEPVVRYYFKQLLEGLKYCHRRGVTHRDLKLSNILFDEDYNIKIGDFGFAAPLEGRDGSSFLTTKVGTRSYMAPELVYQEEYQGAPVDIFSLGVILFAMVSSHPPFREATT